jgi:ABC-2 type transport system permease protein
MHKIGSQILQLFLVIGIILIVNVIGNFFYGQIDLTEEKRFTLSPVTERVVSDISDVVYINVLLEGKFPAGFKRLRNSTEELLKQFKKINPNIEYAFEDPAEGTVEEVNARRKELAEFGIMPVSLKVFESGERSEKLIFPVALLNFGKRTLIVNLLENEIAGASPEENLNSSVSLLEYKFSSALQKIQTADKPVIMFSEGHGELDTMETIDLENHLAPYYNTARLNLENIVQISDEIDLLIIAKPQSAFNDRDKFKIDQYLMRGGRLLILMDKLAVGLDSLRNRPQYVPVEIETELDDILFKYGVRFNPDLVLDLECSRIPLTVGMLGNKPQVELFDWYYHPVVVPAMNHPVTRNLDRVNLNFPGSLDTIQTKNTVEKIPLLTSSKYTRIQIAPVQLSFEILRYEKDPSKFNKPPRTMAMLLEGEFSSAYENRVSEAMLAGLKSMNMEYKPGSVPTRMIVVSDGDIARNHVNKQTGQYNALGFNQFENYRFANRDFLLNAIEYLLDEKGVLDARNKEVKLRLLDTIRAKEEKLKWQILNIGLPLLLLLIFGLIFNYGRKRKYSV